MNKGKGSWRGMAWGDPEKGGGSRRKMGGWAVGPSVTEWGTLPRSIYRTIGMWQERDSNPLTTSTHPRNPHSPLLFSLNQASHSAATIRPEWDGHFLEQMLAFPVKSDPGAASEVKVHGAELPSLLNELTTSWWAIYNQRAASEKVRL